MNSKSHSKTWESVCLSWKMTTLPGGGLSDCGRFCLVVVCLMGRGSDLKPFGRKRECQSTVLNLQAETFCKMLVLRARDDAVSWTRTSIWWVQTSRQGRILLTSNLLTLAQILRFWTQRETVFKMCCENKRRHRGLIATVIYLAVQKIEQRRQRQVIQSRTAECTQSFESPIKVVRSTIPTENPPPYVEENEVVYQRDSKIVRTKSGANERSVYAVDRQEGSILDA